MLLARARVVVPVIAAMIGLSQPGPSTPAGPAGQMALRLEPSGGGVPTDPRERISIVASLRPGAALTRTVTVVNGTARGQHVELYPAAATIVSGTFLGSPERTPNDVTTWTTLSPSTVDLGPGASRPVQVTIRPPVRAAEGEQYAMVWADTTAPGSDELTRAGVRMYLDIGHTPTPASDFAIGRIAPGPYVAGRPTVVVDVTDTGDRAVDIDGTVKLTEGPDGLSTAAIPISRPVTLAPHGAGQVTAVLDPYPPNGDWTAVVSLNRGLVGHEQTAPVTITGSPAIGQRLPLTVPALIAWVGATVLVLAFVALVLRRARRRFV